MSLSSDESSVKDIDTGSSSSSSSTVGDEKSRESRPQEDDTLSSILLMLKSNTNDDDDDVAAADLETLANVIGEDSDPSQPMASIDVTQTTNGNTNNIGENGIDTTFAAAVQTHINRLGSNGDYNGKFMNNSNHNGTPSNNGNINIANTTIGSQKSSISRNIKIDDLRSYFHLPIVEVAKQLGICTTLLKRVCRTNKIKKWPYRQIRSIAKSIQSLEMASMNGMLAEAERDKSQEQITFLKRSLEALIDDPSIPIDAAVEMAMRTVAEDGTLPDFVPNADLVGDSDPLLKPTAAQVIAASVASSSIDRVVLSSKPRPSKRKKCGISESPSGDNLGGFEGCAAVSTGSDTYDGQLPLPPLSIGESIVNQSIWNDGGKQRVTYLPPVQLTPLLRKKQLNPSKKLVPLIEPDICNCFQMDFLPLPLLRLSELSNSSSQVVAAFLVAEASDGDNGVSHIYENCIQTDLIIDPTGPLGIGGQNSQNSPNSRNGQNSQNGFSSSSGSSGSQGPGSLPSVASESSVERNENQILDMSYVRSRSGSIIDERVGLTTPLSSPLSSPVRGDMGNALGGSNQGLNESNHTLMNGQTDFILNISTSPSIHSPHSSHSPHSTHNPHSTHSNHSTHSTHPVPDSHSPKHPELHTGDNDDSSARPDQTSISPTSNS